MIGLLASLTETQIQKYFPDRQFVERQLVEREVRNPGTGEMVTARIWDSINEPAPTLPIKAYPTKSELLGLEEIEWVSLGVDYAYLASLIAYLIEPVGWREHSNEVYQDFMRFESHPRIQYETLYLIMNKYLEPLCRGAEMNFESIFKTVEEKYQYLFDPFRTIELRREIANCADDALKNNAKLIFWYRGTYS